MIIPVMPRARIARVSNHDATHPSRRASALRMTGIARSICFAITGKYAPPEPASIASCRYLADQFGAADLDAGIAGQFQRIGQILQRIFGRERALGKNARHDRLQAVIAQRKTVGRALRQRIEQQRRIDAVALGDRDRLGQRVDGLEQHHVVEDFRHLPRADVAATASRRWQSSGSRARSRHIAPAGAPTITLSVPSCAACRVRAIGASAQDAPLACNCLAKSRV